MHVPAVLFAGSSVRAPNGPPPPAAAAARPCAAAAVGGAAAPLFDFDLNCTRFQLPDPPPPGFFGPVRYAEVGDHRIAYRRFAGPDAPSEATPLVLLMGCERGR